MGFRFEPKWQALADLVMLNAEDELRRDAAGEYRHYSGAHGRGNKARITIYTGALHAASQHPNRAAKLLLKAAGLADWEQEDIDERADTAWKGEWHERGGMAFAEDYVEMPATSWPNGPKRKTSGDFFHSWFDGGACMGTYRAYPREACDATMAFLLDWPKRKLFPGSHRRETRRSVGTGSLSAKSFSPRTSALCRLMLTMKKTKCDLTFGRLTEKSPISLRHEFLNARLTKSENSGYRF